MASQDGKHGHHHILPVKVGLRVFAALIFLTVVTVAVAQVDLGHLNFAIAMLVATIKALLVVSFFMGLKYDHAENSMIFASSFLFLAIFLILTSTDLFFRGDVYVKKGQPLLAAAPGGSTLKNPWVPTKELVAKGKELFAVQCVSCHGAEGKGNGPAAAALIPPPRNFAVAQGWKNGRKPSQIFKTLKEGLAGSAMASFGTLPSDDRWALVQYVSSLGPTQEKDSVEDLKKVGIDPAAGGGEKQAASIPIAVAMSRAATAEDRGKQGAHAAWSRTGGSGAAGIYAAQCASCHGPSGEGGIRVRALGAQPRAYVVTQKLGAGAVASGEAFARLMAQGLPGNLMPAFGSLTSGQIKELHSYVRSLTGGR